MPNPNLIDSLGSILYIADPNGSDTPPADSPDPWTAIGELATIGAISFMANEERSTALGRVKDLVTKGVEPMPAVDLTFNKISGGDDGQDALDAARRDRSQDQWYWFKLVCPDTPAASGSTPTTATFKAKVLGFTPFAQIGAGPTMQGGSKIVIDQDTWDVEEAA